MITKYAVYRKDNSLEYILLDSLEKAVEKSILEDADDPQAKIYLIHDGIRFQFDLETWKHGKYIYSPCIYNVCTITQEELLIKFNTLLNTDEFHKYGISELKYDDDCRLISKDGQTIEEIYNDSEYSNVDVDVDDDEMYMSLESFQEKMNENPMFE